MFQDRNWFVQRCSGGRELGAGGSRRFLQALEEVSRASTQREAADGVPRREHHLVDVLRSALITARGIRGRGLG